MPARTGKVKAKRNLLRQPSPEIPSPQKPIERNIIDDDLENKMPVDEIETKPELLPMNSDESKTDINPLTIILANGQPLLTSFEEKYLVDLILKITNKDIETILQEKLHFILQMNYGASQSSSFTLNSNWIFDFILKHFQTLITHINSQQLFEKVLKKNFDKNNSTITFKHWQLQTLVNEYSKNQQHLQSSSVSQKRRMTVRRID